MADPAPAGTVVPVPTGGGSPQPEFKVPDGKVLIDASEQQTWQRQREQLAGLTRFHGEATKRGFKSPDDFATYDKFDSVLKGKKLTMAQVAEILGGPEKEQEAGNGSLDLSSIEKHFESKGYLTADKLEEARKFDRASFDHERASEREQTLLKTQMSALLGVNPTPKDSYLIQAALKAELADPENRSLYPEGHPLRDKMFAPLDEKSMAKLIEKVKKNLAIEDGKDAVENADKAIKGTKVSTPAGSTNKAPTKAPKPGDEERRPGNLPPKAAVEAAFAKRQAQRGGGPVSSVGGS